MEKAFNQYEALFSKEELESIRIIGSNDPLWQNNAFNFLLKYIRIHSEFQTQDVARAADDILTKPTDPRAWGAIILRAKRAGYIRKVRYQMTEQIKGHSNAHAAPVWAVVEKPDYGKTQDDELDDDDF